VARVAHCLTPLLTAPESRFGLWNRRTGLPIATRLLPAFDSAARRQGLLGRKGLDAGEALVLAPCSAIHTAFMRFPLDLVFLDRAGTVLKTASNVRPWRLRAAWRGFAVVELTAGALEASETRRGDAVEVRTIV
jgi:uncharacterized membrane protein (UPF0127 family)